jgi:hypothetical protein
MRLRSVPARQGTRWVKLGFRTFARQPLAFSALFVAFIVAMSVLSAVPLVGPLVLVALLPLITLGFMVMTEATLGGRFAGFKTLMAPLRTGGPQRRALVQLGLIYAGSSLLIMALSDLIDGGLLDELLQRMSDRSSSAESITELLGDGRLQAGLVVRLGLAALLSVPFWHAPALVHWDHQRCAQSLFSSTLAVWRNRAAFTLFGAVWAALVLGVAFVANFVFGLLGMPQMVAMVALPVSLLLSTVFYVSLYFSFAECFESSPDDPTPPFSTDSPADLA